MLDVRDPLDFERLERLAAEQRESIRTIVQTLHRSPTPDRLIADLEARRAGIAG
jgi:hypothetical protein